MGFQEVGECSRMYIFGPLGNMTGNSDEKELINGQSICQKGFLGIGKDTKREVKC